MENEQSERAVPDLNFTRAGLALLMVGALLVYALAVAAAIPSSSPAAGVAAKLEATKTAGPGNYVVVFRDGVALGSRLRAERSRGIETDEVFRRVFRGFAGELASKDVARLRRDDRVLLVEPDLQVSTQSNGPQNRTVESWGLDRIDQRDRPVNGRLGTVSNGFGVEAYIIDTGIRLDHNQFSGRINPEGFSAFEGGRNDCDGHGTHVAGTVAGSTYGVAPAAKLTAVRVLDCEGAGTFSGVIAGIEWMVEDHRPGEPAVANMSLGGPASEAVNLAVGRAVDDGISMVVAAGNETEDACSSSPASAPEAITVGSTESNDEMSDFSNFGPCVDLFAPGSDIKSAWHTSPSATRTISGTSMASPHVAGAAALLLARDREISPDTVTRRLVESATPDRIANVGCTFNRLLYIGAGSNLPGSPLPPPPANDDFEDRRVIGSLSTTTFRTTCASAETAEPGHGVPPYQYRAVSSVWFEWTAPSAGSLTLDLGEADFEARIAVYSGTSIGNLSLRSRISWRDWLWGETRTTARVAAGETLYVAIAGPSGSSGNARMTGTFTPGPGPSPGDSRPGPPNDNFAHATEIESRQSWSVSGTGEGATAQIGEPNHASWWSGGPFGSVWYRWTAPITGVLRLSSNDEVALYSGDSLRSLEALYPGETCVLCQPQAPVRRGETYSIAVDSSPGLEGAHYVSGSITRAPGNDDFANAARIAKWSGRINGTNVGATNEPHESGHGSPNRARAANSVWYRWTAPWNGNVTLVDKSGDSWPEVTVYTGGSLGSLRKVVSSDWLMDELTWSPRQGETYWIAVDSDSWLGEPGSFSFALRRNMEDLRIVSGPRHVTRSRVAKFRLKGDPGASFQCRLDGQFRWRSCSARATFRRLAPGERNLKVRQKYGTSVSDPIFNQEYWWLILKGRRR